MDLEGQPLTVTVKEAEVETLGQGDAAQEKVVIYSDDIRNGKGFPLNKGAFLKIEEIAGTDDLDQWPGVSLVLFPTKELIGNEIKNVIRVRSVEEQVAVDAAMQAAKAKLNAKAAAKPTAAPHREVNMEPAPATESTADELNDEIPWN